MKHTPGPWIVIDRGARSENVISPNFARFWIGAPSKPGYGPCEVSTVSGNRDEEIPANAHLIAAAPEMLEALELILSNDKLMNAMNREQAQSILEAIKKAKGL